jgi:hypothetical protein
MAAIAGSVVAAAPAALADVKPGVVLIDQPARSVCVGKTFALGVWYQPSGASQAYRVDVYGPGGTLVLASHGVAPSTRWLYWNVRARRVGKYRTVYWTRPSGAHQWTPYRARTVARRC